MAAHCRDDYFDPAGLRDGNLVLRVSCEVLKRLAALQLDALVRRVAAHRRDDDRVPAGMLPGKN